MSTVAVSERAPDNTKLQPTTNQAPGGTQAVLARVVRSSRAERPPAEPTADVRAVRGVPE